MMTFIKHIFTGPDNQTFEMTAFLTFIHTAWQMALAGVGTGLYVAQHWTADFNLKEFGVGLAVVGAAVTAAIAALGYAKGRQYGQMTQPAPGAQ